MKINLTSVLVDDQEKAERFYTQVLGFTKKTEIAVDDVEASSCGCVRKASRSPRSRRRWGRLGPRSSTTHAAT